MSYRRLNVASFRREINDPPASKSIPILPFERLKLVPRLTGQLIFFRSPEAPLRSSYNR
jgi:hypothetical protein